jgi:hypothetical protein
VSECVSEGRMQVVVCKGVGTEPESVKFNQ